ncbi:CHC2 zinc finger domain-containing protein [Altererythrobacter sp. Root672]|uniref:DUF7146 domain-containing protein n=1 Tax=Altererythrobacter sp. Root672 TaxID=1736584 RepID=UPI0006FCFCA1|nr:CHC2 zinc finger domain-containing protein [Altererythrobacter sp. Root672]KRA81624.1 virulence-associated protein E [Altererythrobacter sp. Root672]
MRTLLDLDQIREQHALPSVAAATIKLRKCGVEWKGCCPFHYDRSPSFTIFDGGRRYQCFGCGASGDVLDFVRSLHGVGLREAAQMLTGRELPSIEIEPAATAAKEDRLEEARSIWRSAGPASGTAAETYLRSRGLHLSIPPTIRFARLRYGKSGPEHPCLIAAVAGPDNKLSGIQRTYLNAAGTGKAAVPKPKLSLGRVSGGAIRLAPVATSLVVCEGLEDGLSLQQELGRTVWVAAGASMLPAMRFPDIVTSVAIGGDNDEAGRAAVRKAAETFTARSLTVRTFFPIGGKDFNAELMGAFA